MKMLCRNSYAELRSVGLEQFLILEQRLRITFYEPSNLLTSRKGQNLPKGEKSFFLVEQSLHLC